MHQHHPVSPAPAKSFTHIGNLSIEILMLVLKILPLEKVLMLRRVSRKHEELSRPYFFDLIRKRSIAHIASSGISHMLFLKRGSSLWASGDNSYGKLGIYHDDSIQTPEQVFLSDVTFAGVGWDYSLALKKDGTV